MSESRDGSPSQPAAWPSEVVAADRAVNLQCTTERNMMKARTSLWASLAIAASLGLAGCGGSSNNNDDDPGATTTTPPPAAPVALTLPAGNNIRDRLDQDDEGQTDNFLDGKSFPIPAGGTVDYAGVLFSCPPGGLACTVTFAVNPVGVTATTGGEGSGVATGELKSQVGTGVGLRTLRDEIRTAPDNKAPGNSLADRLGFPHENDPSGAFVSRHLKAPSLEVAGSNSSAAAAAASVWDGWKGAAWQEDRETVVRFDNQAPAESFEKAHGLNIDDANNVTPASDDAGDDFWDLVRAKVAPFPGRSEVLTVDADGDDDYEIDATFDGVDGTLTCSGTAVCTLTAEGTKLLGQTGDSTGWIFTADNPEDEVDRQGTKDDYLAFGWWRQDQSAGGGFSGFEPVYGGRIPFPTGVSTVDEGGTTSYITAEADPNRRQTLNGKATYSGGAAGNYTDYSGRREPSGIDGTFTEEAPDRHGGWFVADAKLTANFGDAGTTPTDDDNRITGMISNFRGAHGSLGDWEVKLGTVPDGNLAGDRALDANTGGEAFNLDPTTNPTVALAASRNTVSGDADGEPWSGGWGVTFYGDTVNVDEDGANDRLPSGVAGWFHAQTQNGTPNVGSGTLSSPTPSVAVQGSFAATR